MSEQQFTITILTWRWKVFQEVCKIGTLDEAWACVQEKFGPYRIAGTPLNEQIRFDQMPGKSFHVVLSVREVEAVAK